LQLWQAAMLQLLPVTPGYLPDHLE